MKKVLHIVDADDIPTVKPHLSHLVEGLSKAGIEADITILARDHNSHFFTDLDDKVTRHLVHPERKGSWGTIWHLSGLIRQLGQPSVHVHHTKAIEFAVLAAKLSGVKCIVTDYHRQSSNFSRHWSLKFAHAIIFSSQKLYTHFEQQFPQKCQLIYPGINFYELDLQVQRIDHKKLEKTIGDRSQRFVLGHIGDLVKENDQETLIKAFRNVIQKGMNAQLMIVGEGSLQEHLSKKVKEFSLEDRVDFMKPERNQLGLLNLMDAYVSSAYEQKDNDYVLQAMALGKPVIVSKIEDYPQWVVQGETGYLVPCGFPERIDNVVMRWKAHPEMAAQMGDKARQHVRQKFNVENMIQKYKVLY